MEERIKELSKYRFESRDYTVEHGSSCAGWYNYNMILLTI